MEARKKVIQDQFLSQLSLRISFPKSGYGSSNDGNTARKFFQYSDKSAEIIGMSVCNFHKIFIIVLFFIRNLIL